MSCKCCKKNNCDKKTVHNLNISNYIHGENLYDYIFQDSINYEINKDVKDIELIILRFGRTNSNYHYTFESDPPRDMFEVPPPKPRFTVNETFYKHIKLSIEFTGDVGKFDSNMHPQIGTFRQDGNKIFVEFFDERLIFSVGVTDEVDRYFIQKPFLIKYKDEFMNIEPRFPELGFNNSSYSELHNPIIIDSSTDLPQDQTPLDWAFEKMLYPNIGSPYNITAEVYGKYHIEGFLVYIIGEELYIRMQDRWSYTDTWPTAVPYQPPWYDLEGNPYWNTVINRSGITEGITYHDRCGGFCSYNVSARHDIGWGFGLHSEALISNYSSDITSYVPGYFPIDGVTGFVRARLETSKPETNALTSFFKKYLNFIPNISGVGIIQNIYVSDFNPANLVRRLSINVKLTNNPLDRKDPVVIPSGTDYANEKFFISPNSFIITSSPFLYYYNKYGFDPNYKNIPFTIFDEGFLPNPTAALWFGLDGYQCRKFYPLINFETYVRDLTPINTSDIFMPYTINLTYAVGALFEVIDKNVYLSLFTYFGEVITEKKLIRNQEDLYDSFYFTWPLLSIETRPPPQEKGQVFLIGG